MNDDIDVFLGLFDIVMFTTNVALSNKMPLSLCSTKAIVVIFIDRQPFKPAFSFINLQHVPHNCSLKTVAKGRGCHHEVLEVLYDAKKFRRKKSYAPLSF